MHVARVTCGYESLLKSLEMETNAVPTLSRRHQRRSIGEVVKRKKEGNKAKLRKPIDRFAVLNPRTTESSDVVTFNKEELISVLKSLIGRLRLPCRKVPLCQIRVVPKDKRSQFRREWALAESTKQGFQMDAYLSLRSSVSIGVNCVSKSLERNELAGLLIETNVSPVILTKLLIPIAESRNVPLIAFDGLNSLFLAETGMRCIAIGFKLCTSEVSHHFYPVLEIIRSQQEKKSVVSPIATLSSPSTTSMAEHPNSSTPSSAKTNSKKRSNHQPLTFKSLKVRKYTS